LGWNVHAIYFCGIRLICRFLEAISNVQNVLQSNEIAKTSTCIIAS